MLRHYSTFFAVSIAVAVNGGQSNLSTVVHVLVYTSAKILDKNGRIPVAFQRL